MASPRPKRIKLEADNNDSAEDPDYLWKLSEHQNEETRLAVKENALAKAQHFAAQLSDVIRQCLKQPDLAQDSAFRQWLHNIDITEEKNKAFKVLVGVSGATGAGKTSILNALLGENEILPSGHEGAATAVPCLVEMNHDEEPGHEYRARIHVMARTEVIEELTHLVQAFKARKALHHYDETSDLTPAQKREELATVNAEIKLGMEKIRPVYNLEEEDIEEIVGAGNDDVGAENDSVLEQKANKILATSRAVGNLIDIGVRDLYAKSAEELASEMKSFLDSTTAQHGDDDDEEFAAWPLIKEVHVFLKADILKTGICLVDLPGVGEAVASRAQVARDFQEKLEVTLLVAPIHRAASENVAQTLLSNHQAAQMELEGSFNNRKLGIVLSKIDDLEGKNYIKGSRDARQDPVVKKFQSLMKQSKDRIYQGQSDIKRLAKLQRESKSQLNRLKNAHSELQCQDEEERLPVKEEEDDEPKPKRMKKLKPTRTTAKMSRTFEAKGKASDTHNQIRLKLHRIGLEKKRSRHDQVIASHGLAYWAVSRRNKRVGEQIRTDMSRRRRKLGASGSMDENGAAILPTSSKAFWRLQDEDAEGLVNGFPHLVYSGVPNLERWIHRATLDRREGHLDEILSSFDMALKGMLNWTSDGERLEMGLASKDVEDMLAETHDQYSKECRALFEKLSEVMKDLDPLGDSSGPEKDFIAAIPGLVRRWNLKYPDDKSSEEIMNHGTHKAIVVRKGADYVAPRSKVRYEWMTGLSTGLVLGVQQCWKNSRNLRVPTVSKRFENVLRDLWTRYTLSIRKMVDTLGHGLGSELNEICDTLREICDQSLQKTRNALDKVFEGHRKVDNVVQRRLDVGLHTFWKRAISYSGKDSFKRRQDFMLNSMVQRSKALFRSIWTEVTQLFQRGLNDMAQRFEIISSEGVAEMRLQISLMLKRVLNEDNSAANSQQEIHRITMLWKSAWQHSGPAEDHVLGRDSKLPEVLNPQHVVNLEEADLESEPVNGDVKTEDDAEAAFEDEMTIDAIEKAIEQLKKVE